MPGSGTSARNIPAGEHAQHHQAAAVVAKSKCNKALGSVGRLAVLEEGALVRSCCGVGARCTCALLASVLMMWPLRTCSGGLSFHREAGQFRRYKKKSKPIAGK